MSVVKVHKVRNKISQQIRRGAGIGVKTAVANAERRMGALKEKLRIEVDKENRLAEALLMPFAEDPDARVDDLYDCADRLAGVAGPSGLAVLSEAALGLCDMLDWMRQETVWDHRAVAVHVNSFRLLAATSDERACRDINEGLKAVRGRYLASQREMGASRG